MDAPEEARGKFRYWAVVRVIGHLKDRKVAARVSMRGMTLGPCADQQALTLARQKLFAANGILRLVASDRLGNLKLSLWADLCECQVDRRANR